jgi:hypothetical protein
MTVSCLGDRTQGHKPVTKTEKSTAEVHSVCHGMYVATETGGRCGFLCVTARACAWETATGRATHATMHRYHSFSANKQTCDTKSSKRVDSAVSTMNIAVSFS